VNKFLNIALTLLLLGLITACGSGSSSSSDEDTDDDQTEQTVDQHADDQADDASDDTSDDVSDDSDSVAASANSVCQGKDDLTGIPTEYVAALTKYISTNTEYLVNVCTEDVDDDGDADYMVVESTNLPEHDSVYFDESHAHYADYDFETNIHKFDDIYTDQVAHSAGNNQISEQEIVMRMPISPAEATNKTATVGGTIGLALNGVAFFNENAAPGDEITDELFTFDQCSGHPQNTGIYHYHVDPVCLIRDLGGSVTEQSATEGTTTYSWIEDDGTNADFLLGFIADGFPVYGPVGNGETDCNSNAVTEVIDEYNGHSHCTSEFSSAIYHYHVKTANLGGTNSPVFWITNTYYYGEPGSIE
jgi:hypothetical protein